MIKREKSTYLSRVEVGSYSEGAAKAEGRGRCARPACLCACCPSSLGAVLPTPFARHFAPTTPLQRSEPTKHACAFPGTPDQHPGRTPKQGTGGRRWGSQCTRMKEFRWCISLLQQITDCSFAPAFARGCTQGISTKKRSRSWKGKCGKRMDCSI